MQIESVLRAILVADPVVSGMVGTQCLSGTALPREPTFPGDRLPDDQPPPGRLDRYRPGPDAVYLPWRVPAARRPTSPTRCGAASTATGASGTGHVSRTSRYAGQHDDYDETTGIHWIPGGHDRHYLEET